jgi:hypothetical protein
MTKILNNKTCTILTLIFSSPLLTCQYFQFGCVFFNFTLGVIIISIAFCSVYVYSLALHWKAVYSFNRFLRMFDGIQKWTLLYFILSILLLVLIVNSYKETAGTFESGLVDSLNTRARHFLNFSEDSNEMVIARNKLAYSISLTMYLFGQMLIVKTKTKI